MAAVVVATTKHVTRTPATGGEKVASAGRIRARLACIALTIRATPSACLVVTVTGTGLARAIAICALIDRRSSRTISDARSRMVAENKRAHCERHQIS